MAAGKKTKTPTQLTDEARADRDGALDAVKAAEAALKKAPKSFARESCLRRCAHIRNMIDRVWR